MSTFSTKREIRKFHVAVVQRRQRKVRTRVLHVQSCFAYLTLIFFCRSRCRRRRRCLSSLYSLTPEMAGMVKCLGSWGSAFKTVLKGLASLFREIPQELLALSRRGEVHVNMEDHKHEEYVPPPKPKVQAFSGAGHKLGRYAMSFSFF